MTRECPVCGEEFTPTDEINTDEVCSWSCVEQGAIDELLAEVLVEA